jgi:hypothetical protein
MKIKTYFVCAAIITSFLFIACVSVKPMYFSDDLKLGEKAVGQFHQSYNDKNFGAIYDAARDEAKANKSKDKLVEYLDGIYSQYGKVQKTKLVKSNVSVLNGKERQIEVIYQTDYDNGRRNELFLMIADDTSAKLDSYGELTDEELRNLPETPKK